MKGKGFLIVACIFGAGGYYEELTRDASYNAAISIVAIIWVALSAREVKNLNRFSLVLCLLCFVTALFYFLEDKDLNFSYPVLGFLLFALFLGLNRGIPDFSLQFVLFLIFITTVVELLFFEGVIARASRDGYGSYRPLGLLQGPNASALGATYILYYLTYHAKRLIFLNIAF